jgi:hypothetical protein
MNEERVSPHIEDYKWVEEAFKSVFPDDETAFKHFDCGVALGLAVRSNIYKRRHAFLVVSAYYDINEDIDKFNVVSMMLTKWNEVKHSPRLPIEEIL